MDDELHVLLPESLMGNGYLLPPPHTHTPLLTPLPPSLDCSAVQPPCWNAFLRWGVRHWQRCGQGRALPPHQHRDRRRLRCRLRGIPHLPHVRVARAWPWVLPHDHSLHRHHPRPRLRVGHLRRQRWTAAARGRQVLCVHIHECVWAGTCAGAQAEGAGLAGLALAVCNAAVLWVYCAHNTAHLQCNANVPLPCASPDTAGPGQCSGGGVGLRFLGGSDAEAIQPYPLMARQSASECAAACSGNPLCRKYVWYETGKLCYLMTTGFIGTGVDPAFVSGACTPAPEGERSLTLRHRLRACGGGLLLFGPSLKDTALGSFKRLP